MKAFVFICLLWMGVVPSIQGQNPTDLGVFSISLNVKNIQSSVDFYTALGFEVLDGAGSVAQKWIILKNGNAKIGLFQGMFSSNVITFNPSDARTIAQRIAEAKIPTTFSNGLEKEAGPCSFTFTDPDGNVILIDQH